MLEGWLTKRRDHMNIIWMDRYFILDGNHLRYYRKRGDPTPRGTYVLNKGCVIGNVFNSEEKHKHHGPVWMFRITFGVGEGEKSYKKDRFIDLGAKTQEEAYQWKRGLELAISSVRDLAKNISSFTARADIGETPVLVKKILHDDDAVSLFNLASEGDKNDDFWLSHAKEGMRIMEECPNGHDNAAQEFASHAAAFNQTVVWSATLAILSFSMAYSSMQNMLISTATGILASLFPVFLHTNNHKRQNEVHSFKVSQVVSGSPTEIFRLIMNEKRIYCWDNVSASTKVVQEVDDHADIIYHRQNPIFVWPMWMTPRDMVLMRYWRREEDGSYFIMFQSTSHPECRPQHGFVRGNLLGGGFTIAPQKTPAGELKSHVTYVLRYDPKGYSRWYRAFGWELNLVLPMLRSVLSIRDQMAAIDFIKPMVTSDGGGREEPSQTVVAATVDSSGIILGVKKIPSTLAEQSWVEPEAAKFLVRGPTYLSDRKKAPAGPAGFHLVGVDLFAFENPKERYNVAGRSDSVVAKCTDDFTFVVNMIIPGADNMSMIFYFQPARPNLLSEGSAFAELLNDFIDGDDNFRNSRFKLIPTVVEGTFIIKQSVGSKPALIGNKLDLVYSRGPNYFEVDIDISSNSVANTVVGLVRGVTKSLVVDMAFLLESQSEEELPETILGTVRLQRVSLDNPVKIKSQAVEASI